MTTKKNTKRALFGSLAIIALCLIMLVGTTFAWFTDTASTGVSTIQSGTLGVEITGTFDDQERLNFRDANGKSEILWEPGATFKTDAFQVKSSGNLSLKYKISLSGVTGDDLLLEAIDFTVVKGDGTAVDLSTFEGHLTPDAPVSENLYIQGHMKETADNKYQGKTLEGIGIAVVATQDTVEYDSYGNQYDAQAAYPEYPAGITKESFQGNQKAVDDKGTFYTDFKTAMENVSNDGSLYFLEGTKVDFQTHLNVTKSVNIYGNGADFSGKDISIGTYAVPGSSEVTVNIHGTKNLVVWGQPENGVTWNVNFIDCQNDGYNFLMYRGDAQGTDKINLTMTNCTASGFRDSIVHTSADGTIKITNCTFSNNCAPINISHKQGGSMAITVENCKFINCGKVNPTDDYFAPARFVNNSTTGTLTVNLKNNTFTGTIGTNGDILLGDYRANKESHALTATITTASPVMVKSSAEAAYSYNGGTITLN